MRNVIDKAMNVFGQRKSKSSRQEPSQTRSAGVAVKPADWDMSPEDALRVGTVAGYK